MIKKRKRKIKHKNKFLKNKIKKVKVKIYASGWVQDLSLNVTVVGPTLLPKIGCLQESLNLLPPYFMSSTWALKPTKTIEKLLSGMVVCPYSSAGSMQQEERIPEVILVGTKIQI